MGGGGRGERERCTDQKPPGVHVASRRAGAVWRQLKAAPRGSNVPVIAMVAAVAVAVAAATVVVWSQTGAVHGGGR